MAIPPLPDGLPDDRVHRTANSLHSSAVHLLRRARVVDREAGLTSERLSLLSVLAFAGPRTISELADAEMVSRPAISRIVTGLEQARLVRRERTQPDRRRVLVHPTRRGKQLMETARSRRIAVVASRLEALDARSLGRLERAADLIEEVLR